MSPSQFRMTNLCAALLSLGLATGVSAQSNKNNYGNNDVPAATQSQGTMTDKDAAKQNGAMSSGDRKFVDKAAMGGMAEVQLGQLAEQKASSDEVKQFAQKMTDDHSKANDELKQLASSKGVQVPTTLDKSQQKEMQKLQKLSGADFDREYMKHMVSDHKQDVSAFEKESKSGKDADVKSFATSTLPTLQEHMQMAQSTYDSVKKTSKSTSSSNSTSSTRSTGSTGGTGSTSSSTGK